MIDVSEQVKLEQARAAAQREVELSAARLQILSFLVAVVLTIVFGVAAAHHVVSL